MKDSTRFINTDPYRQVAAILLGLLFCLQAGSIFRWAAVEFWMGDRARLPRVETACRLDPSDPECAYVQAELTEQLARDARTLWQRLISLDPRDARYLTAAAVSAEAADSTAVAVRLLLQAARYNHLWMPRWSLANFYARHGNSAEFFHWTRLALERQYDNSVAIFRATEAAGATPRQMLSDVLPPDANVRMTYFWFLLDRKQWDAVAPAVDSIVPLVPSARREVFGRNLAAATTALNGAGRHAEAGELWDRLCRQALLPYSAWTAERPLVNAAFGPPVVGQSFDWTAAPAEGIQILLGTPPGAAKFSLNGYQPESHELLSQIVRLAPQLTYRFTFDYRTRGIEAVDSGLYWRLSAMGEPAQQALAPLPLASEEWQPAALSIAPSATPRFLRLALVLERRRGHTRVEGDAWVRNLSLEAVR
jgi:tetratricopeptide (TPR) repeat protein